MHATTDKRGVYLISGVDERFLVAIYRYHMLKPEHLIKRYYSKGSLTFVKARLKLLTDHGYLEANEQPTTRGRSPFFYTLGGRGIRYLKEAGFKVNRYYRPSRKVEFLPFLSHTFTVNDVLIGAELLGEHQPHLTLAEVQHELSLKQDPCKVPMRRDVHSKAEEAATHHVTIVPDGWLDFRYDRGDGGAERRMCLWLEVDRGTVGKKEFKAKAAAILAFYQSGGYFKRFGTNSLRVAFATTAGLARVNQMRAWLRDVLGQRLAKPGIAERFVCTALPDEIDPRALFLSPVWYTPTEHSLPVPLLAIDS